MLNIYFLFMIYDPHHAWSDTPLDELEKAELPPMVVEMASMYTCYNRQEHWIHFVTRNDTEAAKREEKEWERLTSLNIMTAPVFMIPHITVYLEGSTQKRDNIEHVLNAVQKQSGGYVDKIHDVVILDHLQKTSMDDLIGFYRGFCDVNKTNEHFTHLPDPVSIGLALDIGKDEAEKYPQLEFVSQ